MARRVQKHHGPLIFWVPGSIDWIQSVVSTCKSRGSGTRPRAPLGLTLAEAHPQRCRHPLGTRRRRRRCCTALSRPARARSQHAGVGGCSSAHAWTKCGRVVGDTIVVCTVAVCPAPSPRMPRHRSWCAGSTLSCSSLRDHAHTPSFVKRRAGFWIESGCCWHVQEAAAPASLEAVGISPGSGPCRRPAVRLRPGDHRLRRRRARRRAARGRMRAGLISMSQTPHPAGHRGSQEET